MSLLTSFPLGKSSSTSLKPTPSLFLSQSRARSSSPYGRSHILKRRPNKLPNPVVPHFPQRVIRSDGSTFVHWTTSPRSLFRLTRDLTNNPLWNSGSMSGQRGEDELVGGRVGRFNRRFEGMGGSKSGSSDIDWMEIGEDGTSDSKAKGGK